MGYLGASLGLLFRLAFLARSVLRGLRNLSTSVVGRSSFSLSAIGPVVLLGLPRSFVLFTWIPLFEGFMNKRGFSLFGQFVTWSDLLRELFLASLFVLITVNYAILEFVIRKLAYLYNYLGIQ
ncbi:hypothetical protein V0288_17910 [Pannus brasiliensis CCIBt3594]|uniref:Uncharacterized protein n=1 Tax=Pannus brasiliensis CCIBt3594 TaxID=1427578 RepID=A0AAW9QXS7_9CHRO